MESIRRHPHYTHYRTRNKNLGRRAAHTINKRDSHSSPIARQDNPLRRARETERDLRTLNRPIGRLRLEALAHARAMPISGDGSLPSPTQDHVYSQARVSGRSNWLQVGPTAVPNGQTTSSYYSPSNIPVLVTGRITSIVIDHCDTNIIYVGTALGGVWKTQDGGRNWVATSDYSPSLGIGALVMDPNSERRNILYAGTGEGNLWSEKEAIGISHPDNYYGCGILKTIDAGGKWTLISEHTNPFIGTSFFRLAISPTDSSMIFAATASGLFRSVDAGNNWVRLANGLPLVSAGTIACTDVAINPVDPNIAYAGYRRIDINDKTHAGVYKTTNAKDANPIWTKIPFQIDDNIDMSQILRISLTISRSPAHILYALMTTTGGIVDRFYRLDDGKESSNWKRISLPSEETYWNNNPDYPVWEKDSIGRQGEYNLNIAVDPDDADIVYLSGISLWKATRDRNTHNWRFRDIGLPIHADHHAFAFDPKDHRTIYAGSDGGLYKSVNGGETWSDTMNEGLCTTQFEFMDHHPTTDSVIVGGTQDNGTLQYRNSPAFYFSAYGDGGFVSIDKNNPNIVIRQYTNHELEFSTKAGDRDSWGEIPVLNERGDPPPSLFYAPFTLDQVNPNNIAFGSDRIFLDARQGLNRWMLGGRENSIKLNLDTETDEKPMELVSAINFVNSNLIYAATIYGKIYRITKSAGRWKSPARIDDPSPLPQLYIWDIVTNPDDPNTIIVIMAGYGSERDPSSHIWRGISKDDENSFEWEPINGTGLGELPSVPINAIVIDDKSPNLIYVGTDIGVFRTSNNGRSWIRFSENLPVCAVYDMRLSAYYQEGRNLSKAKSLVRFLRIATHGRGMWERQLDIETYNDINLYVRDNLMDTGHFSPSPIGTHAAFADPLQSEKGGVKLNDKLTWDMCPDIKIDSSSKDLRFFQFDNLDSVDYVKFESRLQHRNLRRGDFCNIYAQIHARGIKSTVENATVKLFYAGINGNGKYPRLPHDFWTNFTLKPESHWKPILPSRNLPEGQKTLTNTEPTILVWQWYVPYDLPGGRIGILIVVESPDDPILPDSKKLFDVRKLVLTDRHVGLRTIKVV